MNSRTNKGFSPCHRSNFTGHIFRISASFYYCYYYAGNPRRITTRKPFLDFLHCARQIEWETEMGGGRREEVAFKARF